MIRIMTIWTQVRWIGVSFVNENDIEHFDEGLMGIPVEEVLETVIYFE